MPVHPAERKNQVSTCVTLYATGSLAVSLLLPATALQLYFSRLLLCCGLIPSRENSLLHGLTHVSQAFLAKEAGCIVAQLEIQRSDSAQPRHLGSKYDTSSSNELETPLLTVTDRLLIVATQIQPSLQVYHLPDLYCLFTL